MNDSVTKCCVYFAAFVLLRKFGGETNHSLDEVLESVPLSEMTKSIIRFSLEKKWDDVCKASNGCSPKDYATFFRNTIAGSESLVPAAWESIFEEILAFSEGDRVGYCLWEDGLFLAKLLEKAPGNLLLTALNADEAMLALLEMRMFVLQPSRSLDLASTSIFELDEEAVSFTKSVCAVCPGKRANGISEYLEDRDFTFSELNEFVEVFRVMELLEADGLCVALMMTRALGTTPNRNARRLLAERYAIEAIINLPVPRGRRSAFMERFDFSLVILRNQVPDAAKHQVLMVNGRDVAPEKVLRALRQSKEAGFTADLNAIACKVPLDTILKNKKCSFEKLQYQAVPNELMAGKMTQALGYLATVARGIVESPKVKASRTTEKPEGDSVLYATQLDINEYGMIKPSQYIPCSELEESDRDSLITGSGIVICTRMARPTKYAVLNLPEGEKLLIGSNLYSIKCKEDKLDPYYLMLFLSSPLGKLASAMLLLSGAIMPSISIANLKSLQVSYPPIEEQRKIAAKYKEILAVIEEKQNEIDACRQTLKELAEKL